MLLFSFTRKEPVLFFKCPYVFGKRQHLFQKGQHVSLTSPAGLADKPIMSDKLTKPVHHTTPSLCRCSLFSFHSVISVKTH